jgi:hypothetical protein
MDSNQFTPRPAARTSPKFNNVKVWGQSNKSSGGYGDGKINKVFSADKDRLSKIFAPKITIIDEPSKFESSVITDDSQKIEAQTNENIVEKYIDAKIQDREEKTTEIFEKLKIKTYTVDQQKNSVPGVKILNQAKKSDSNFNFFANIKSMIGKFFENWWDSIKFDYYEKEWFRKINYQFLALNIFKNINKIIVTVVASLLIVFFLYLSFFDQYFTIKKYTVQYSTGSYLNNIQTNELINHFQKNKLYNIFPNNQYWFANGLSLTASAREVFPEIKSVKVSKRDWPNKVTLTVETNEPILTLAVIENNEQKYWRVNENGKISSQDKAAIWYNLVKVEKPYTLQDVESQQTLSLFSHSFETNTAQKQRFTLTKKLLDYFKAIDLQINSITYPSISDTDIVMESNTGTKFSFDSLILNEDLQIERLDYFLKSKLEKLDFYDLEKKKEFKYLDFRVSNKVHFCKVDEKCDIKTESQP